MAEHLSLQQLSALRRILFAVCPVVLAAFILISVLWTNVPAMVIFGVLYIVLVIALILVSTRHRRRKREAASLTLSRLTEPVTQGVFVIESQTPSVLDSQAEMFSQSYTQGVADDDPPPPYSELPLDVIQKGARIREHAIPRVHTPPAAPQVHATRSTASPRMQATKSAPSQRMQAAKSAPSPRMHVTKSTTNSIVEIQSTSAINENVYWNNESMLELGQGQPKLRAPAAKRPQSFFQSKSTINENANYPAELDQGRSRPRSRGPAFVGMSSVNISYHGERTVERRKRGKTKSKTSETERSQTRFSAFHFQSESELD